MNFSQRIGKTPLDDPLQVDSAGEELRSALWNVLYRFLVDSTPASGSTKIHEELLDDLWERFYKLPVDERPQPKHAFTQLKHWVMNCDWFRLYDLLEFLVDSMPPRRVAAFEAACNKALERERSAYRLIRGMVVPISDAIEFESVAAATDGLREHGIEAARQHLGNALGELSQRVGAGDYDFAASEAVLAVRSLYEHLAGQNEATLKDAIAALDPQGLLPSSFPQALELFFPDGSDGNPPHLFHRAERDTGLAEARLLVVSASAVIHYLLDLAERIEPLERRDDAQKQLPGDPPAAIEGEIVEDE